MRFFLCISIVLIGMLSFAGMAQAQELTAYQKKILELDKKDDKIELYKALMQTESRSDNIHALDFLQKRIFTDKVYDSDYHAVYAKLLWEQGIKDSAAAMAAANLLILYNDRLRCADDTAGYTKITKRFTMFKDMLEYLRDQTLDDKLEIIEVALDVEERIDNRPPNRNMCYTGVKATAEALKYAQENDLDLEKTGPDSYVIPEYKQITVEYVDDHEWHKRREEMRAEFPKYFMKGR
jgi:hypothetical protein